MSPIGESLKEAIKKKCVENCLESEEFLRAEAKELREQIMLHKYFLSQKASDDVGKKYAVDDFMKNHYHKWAEHFRNTYCDRYCHKPTYKVIFQSAFSGNNIVDLLPQSNLNPAT